MGRPKALIPYQGSTFLEHLMAVTRHPAVGVTRIVLGAGADELQRLLKLAAPTVVINPDWEQGQLSSIQAGLRSLAGLSTEGMVLCPVDHPLVSAKLVEELIAKFYAHRTEGKTIVVPTYDGRRGHPIILSSALYGELLEAPVDKGARAVVWAHQAEVLEVPTGEEGVLLNINDPIALSRAIPDAE
jgi:molybdenum cofactor cytidylyltransferase